jgi:hypothetical protein
MVDETAFRKVLRSTDPMSCAFGKAILAACCECPMMAKHYVAERETPVCIDASMRAVCQELHDLLIHNSAFALRHIHEGEPLTHAQEMKAQCGGLHGLQLVMDGSTEVNDVAALVKTSLQEFGSLERLPYSHIVQSVASFKMRRRHDGE